MTTNGYAGKGNISANYAAGRVASLSKTLLTRSALQRVAEAADCREAARALSDLGWADCADRDSAEKAAEAHVRAARDTVQALSPEARVTDCFLYKYDILNLKTLVKGKSLGLREAKLSPLGTIPPKVMRQAVESGDYTRLPPEMSEALSEIAAANALAFDPLMTDAALDKLLFSMISRALKVRGHAVEKKYFAEQADIANLLIALRARSLKKGAAFAEKLFVDGGRISRSALKRVCEEPEQAMRIVVGREWAATFAIGLEAYQRGGELAPLEKRADDYLVGLMRPHRYEPDSVLPLVGYLIAREREAAGVRLIMAAKASGISRERLTERLRELYA